MNPVKKFFNSIPNVVIALIGFVFVILVFFFWSDGASLSAYNLKVLVNTGIVTAIVATGAVFIFSMGMIDISLGATACVATIIGAHAANANMPVPIILLVCVVSAVAISLFSGMCITIFKLPAFIITLSMQFVLSALATILLGKVTTLTIPGSYLQFDTLTIKLIAIIFVMALCVFFFNYSKIGRRNKIIGGNPMNAIQSGIKLPRNVMSSFAISGTCVGIAAMILLFRSGGASASTGTSLGFDIIVALVLGGMPISGGAKSNVFAGAIGAFTITALNNGLIIVGVPNGAVQAVRGVLFLIIVMLMMLKARPKYLPQ